jgi:hypothetical protein
MTIWTSIGRGQSFYLFFKKGDKTGLVITGEHHFCQLRTKFYPANFLSRLTPISKEIIWDHQCGSRCNRLPHYHIFCFRQTVENQWEYNETVHQLLIDFKKTYDSVISEMCNTLTEFGLPITLVMVIKCD